MGRRFQLDNRLRVVFEEQHAAKVAAFQIWVKAGSADERPDEAGIAHLHEHMLFKGTQRRGPGEIARAIEERGGEINAWTSFDQTVYHLVVASQYAPVGIEVLADAIRNSSFESAELAREIEVVCEEIRRANDLPARRASRDLFATAYRVHPYRRPVIGSEESVRSFTRERVLDFYRRNYTPKNMVLAAAGDFSETDLRSWAEELLGGDWGGPGPGRSARDAEPPRAERRILVREDVAKEVHLSLAFGIPSVEHEDAPAIDLLAVLLGQGEASRLVMEVKRRRSLVNDVRAFAYTPRDPGLMVASIAMAPHRIDEAVALTARLVFQLRSNLPSAEELSTAKALMEAEAVYQRETVQGLSRKLGFFEASAGGIEAEAEYYAKLAALTPEQVRATAERYFRGESAVLVALVPAGTPFDAALANDILDRAATADSMPAAERRVPQPPPSPVVVTSPIAARRDGSGLIVERLPSGASILIREEAAAPLFAIRASFLGGLRYENSTNNGLTALLARMMTRGTQRHDAEEISHLINNLSGGLSGQAGRNSVSLRGEFLSRHFDRAFVLFADCLLNPAFPDAELERERKLMLQDIATREDSPAGLAHDLFAKTLYHLHPYRMPSFGQAQSVEQLTAETLREYIARYQNPSQMTLCVVGDVKADRVLALAREAFGAKDKSGAPPPPIELEPPLEGPRSAKHILTRAQSHALMGFPGARVNDSWRHELEVLSTVLSGQGGRLFTELRDKRSLAYSVSSFNVEGVDPGYFAVYIATSPQKLDSALAGIREQLARARDEPIAPAELRRAQQHLIGTHEIGLQRNGARAALLALDHCYGLGVENFTAYADRISRVTAEQVQAVARRVIDRDSFALAVVGP
jgi:zinc protease